MVPGGGAVLLQLMVGDRLTLVNDEGGQPVELVVAAKDGRIDAAILGQASNSTAEGLKAMLAQGDPSLARLRKGLESRRIDLEVKRARAKRANDFIDRELKREDAQTDVIQADADVKRNVSSGTKSYLEGAGKGVEAAGKRATVPNNLTIHNKNNNN